MAHRPVRGGGRRDLGGPEHQPGPGGRPDSHGTGLAVELREVAEVFATGAIDYRMVATIISRTDNVEPDRKADVDAAIARHCVKWMRLSGPKLRDRVDLWVAKHDPDAVRVPPKVEDNRFVDIGEISRGHGRDLRSPRVARCRPAGRHPGRVGGHRVRQRSAHQGAAPRRRIRAVGAPRKHDWPAGAAQPTARR